MPHVALSRTSLLRGFLSSGTTELCCSYVDTLRVGTCSAGMRQKTARKLRSFVMGVDFNCLWIFYVGRGEILGLVLI